MSLVKPILRRILYACITLLFLSFVTFMADEMAPGDQATVLAGEKATLQTVVELREKLGLNRPWPVRYGEYVANAARLDFGTSYYGTKEPVIEIIKRVLPMTIRIAFISIAVAALLGVILGTIAAINRDRWPEGKKDRKHEEKRRH